MEMRAARNFQTVGVEQDFQWFFFCPLVFKLALNFLDLICWDIPSFCLIYTCVNTKYHIYLNITTFFVFHHLQNRRSVYDTQSTGIGIFLKIVNTGHPIYSILFIWVNMVFISSFCITFVILTFVQNTDHLFFYTVCCIHYILSHSFISIQPWRLGLVGTRAQSCDWYGSGTVLGGSLPLLSSAFRRSHFSRQMPPSAMTREILAAKGGTVGEKDVR